MENNMAGLIVGILAVIVGGGAGIFFALYALGFFNYLGGKKSNPNAVSRDVLYRRILELNDPSKPYHIIQGKDSDLMAEWKIVDATWYGIFNKNRLSEAYRALLLLDDSRHSVRCFEELGSVNWSAGASGLIPSVHYQKRFFQGRILYKKEIAVGYGIKQLNPVEAGKVYDYKFDVNEIRNPIIDVVKESGWEWVPVTARRHVMHGTSTPSVPGVKEKAGFCRQCGMKLRDDAVFCPRCGQKVS